jgi:hypothetical protein
MGHSSASRVATIKRKNKSVIERVEYALIYLIYQPVLKRGKSLPKETYNKHNS